MARLAAVDVAAISAGNRGYSVGKLSYRRLRVFSSAVLKIVKNSLSTAECQRGQWVAGESAVADECGGKSNGIGKAAGAGALAANIQGEEVAPLGGGATATGGAGATRLNPVGAA